MSARDRVATRRAAGMSAARVTATTAAMLRESAARQEHGADKAAQQEGELAYRGSTFHNLTTRYL
jgi:hypothetical protein